MTVTVQSNYTTSLPVVTILWWAPKSAQLAPPPPQALAESIDLKNQNTHGNSTFEIPKDLAKMSDKEYPHHEILNHILKLLLKTKIQNITLSFFLIL